MEAITETISYFHKGGLVMWPLLFCSIMVVTIAIERYLYYKESDSGSKFTTEFCSLLSQDKLDEAVQLAASSKGVYADITAQAAAMKQANCSAFMETRAGIFIAHLRSKINYLSIIVTMAPLLGLLGTIVGMINSFSIFDLQSGEPMAITGGIGEALIATASGLCVAILALCVHSYFAHRMDEIITNMEQCFSALLEAKTRSEA